jgi:type VI secretion system protein ImpA
MNVAREELEANASLAKSARATVDEICTMMNEKVQDSIVAMDSLAKELDRLSRFYEGRLESASGTGDAVSAGGEEVQAGAPSRGQAFNPQSQINSRQEALVMLRKGAEYFQKTEPSSPIPLLVNRALRFADMGFIDLLGEIAPDSLSRGRDILGVKPPENS